MKLTEEATRELRAHVKAHPDKTKAAAYSALPARTRNRLSFRTYERWCATDVGYRKVAEKTGMCFILKEFRGLLFLP